MGRGFRVRDGLLLQISIYGIAAANLLRSVLCPFSWERDRLCHSMWLEARTLSSKPECPYPVTRYLQVTQYDVGDSYELHRDSSIEAKGGALDPDCEMMSEMLGYYRIPILFFGGIHDYNVI